MLCYFSFLFMLQFIHKETSMIENWQIPLLMTFLAGLATILGGFITFFVNKNNMKVLSLGLGF